MTNLCAPSRYEAVFVKELRHCLETRGTPHMSLSEVLRYVKKPPALRCSTMVFLRQYPDMFLLEVHEITGHCRLRLNGLDERGDPTELAGPVFVA